MQCMRISVAKQRIDTNAFSMTQKLRSSLDRQESDTLMMGYTGKAIIASGNHWVTVVEFIASVLSISVTT